MEKPEAFAKKRGDQVKRKHEHSCWCRYAILLRAVRNNNPTTTLSILWIFWFNGLDSPSLDGI